MQATLPPGLVDADPQTKGRYGPLAGIAARPGGEIQLGPHDQRRW
jgi:hypothetical protein